MYNKSLFIFRRAFRLEDNTALIQALKNSKEVIPIFIFTPEQVDKNKYKSNNAIQFMIESLIELDKELKKKKSNLNYFYDEIDILDKIIKKENIDAIYVNMDYTKYSTDRDKKIEKICKKKNIDFKVFEDILLLDIGTIRTNNNIYKKFTPYFKKAKLKKIRNIQKNNYNNYFKKSISTFKNIKQFYKENNNISVRGGRSNALKILKNLLEFKNYNTDRNLLSLQTTRLSAYNKFGCISIREVYHSLKKVLSNSNQLFTQLHWRDFYYNIAYFYPHVFKGAMKEKYNNLKWDNNTTYFNKWKKGETGYPIVDAGMREMNETGYMHNRARLITSNFLIKLLLIDWRKGEQYYATQLVDYDPSVNNGNWQWGAGSGADSQPYFRIFNPWLQSKKFDKECEYIKKWLPELKDVDNKDIHNWEINYKDYSINYPKPIIDYKSQKEKSIVMYKKLF